MEYLLLMDYMYHDFRLLVTLFEALRKKPEDKLNLQNGSNTGNGGLVHQNKEMSAMQQDGETC